MPDREKVISTFEKIISVCKEDGCDFVDLTFEDAEQILALLKQEAVAIEWKCGFPHCPVCGQMLPEGDAVRFCLHCGRAVKFK